MRTSRGSRVAAAVGSAAAVLLLLWPVALPPGSSLWRAAGGSAHVLLFAGLSWMWGRQLPNSLRGWALWGALVVFSGLAELLQPQVGRSAEWMDWFYGAAGAACICASWNGDRLARARWAGVGILCLVPPAWEGALFLTEMRAFPVLAEPGPAWAERGWTESGVRMISASGEGFRVEADPVSAGTGTDYPGVFRSPACSDWRGAESLRARLFWPAPNQVFFALRVDDRPGNAPYADRFQLEFAVTQGWNSVAVPVEDLRRTSGGRTMDLSAIRHWGVFLVSDSPFDYFLLGSVSLDLLQERP